MSSRHHARHGLNRLNEAGSGADFLTRSIRRVIDEETAKLESGLTVLASVGSTAPFVGLFGTVWGVYHALDRVRICYPIETFDYGMREFAIYDDNNGYVLQFGRPLPAPRRP